MRVLFFAQLKDVTGCDSVEILSPAPLTAHQLWTELLKQFPELAAHRSSVRLANHCEYAGPDTVFASDDEIALIPPVSGG
ncbi:MAG TPA: MoaD/ThiS family protein [Verrucomicrobiae bacterium]|nr:MoaD/ThiS family protein [Verrucomicrobiae bacterium]